MKNVPLSGGAYNGLLLMDPHDVLQTGDYLVLPAQKDSGLVHFPQQYYLVHSNGSARHDPDRHYVAGAKYFSLNEVTKR